MDEQMKMPPVEYTDFKYDDRWQWEEDGLTVSRTSVWTAPGCHEGCGVLVYTNDEGKVVKVEGDPNDPFNMGRLCPRCFCLTDVLYHSQRVVYPMKRDKSQRGNADAWERCSWDEALDICEREYKAIAEKYGPDSIHFQRGTGRDIIWQNGRLAYAVGSPNEYGALSGISCYLPRMAQMIMTVGGQQIPDMSAFLPGRFDDPAYEVPSCIICWGCNPLNSNPDYQLGWGVTECMKRGAKVITVDPRVTWIAARSEVHLRLRPGTDGALALGMANVLIEEGLYDREFVEKWVHGFDEFSQRVADYTPEKVAEICWIDADDIRAAARLFAEAKPASIFWGLAVDMQNSGVGAAMAIEALWILTGNVENPGGMVYTRLPGNVSLGVLGGWGLNELPKDIQEARVGLQKYPMYRFGITYSQPDTALAEALEGKTMKGLWIQTTNTLVGMGQEPDKWEKVMSETEFCAAVDLFMTPTIQRCADVFLPVACNTEKNSFRAQYYNIATINKIVEPQGEAKSDLEIDLLLGKRFSEHFWPWENEKECLDEALAPSGFTFDELREHGPAYPKFEYHKHEKGMLRPDGQPGFATPTGKLELFSCLFDQFGLEPMAHFREPNMGPVASPELYEQYPIILMTGARSPVFFHSEHRQVPHLRQFNEDPFVELHPNTADDLGVSAGQWVWLENPNGRCRQRVKITRAVREGMALGQHGWWYPESDASEDPMYGSREVNINHLLTNAVSNLGYGSDIKCVLCKIYPVQEGEM